MKRKIFALSPLSVIATLFFSGCSMEIFWDDRDEISLEKPIEPHVTAAFETDPVPGGVEDDAADDPAIWINRTDPTKSVIYGTDKKGGVAVYNLMGKQVQYLEAGNINNIDVRTAVRFKGRFIDLAAASNRSDRTIDLFEIEPTSGRLERIDQINIGREIDDLYGFCLGQNSDTGKTFAILNGKNGIIQQWEVASTANTQHEIVRTLTVPAQPEGMVADDELGFLYVGEEEKGIWRFELDPSVNSEGELIAGSIIADNPNFVADIEGVSIYSTRDKEGYLIASVQGNNSYAIFDRKPPNAYIKSFSITGSDQTDGVEETDGLDVTTKHIPELFPSGFLVVQDGYNFEDDGNKTTQNFKIVDWAKIVEVLNL